MARLRCVGYEHGVLPKTSAPAVRRSERAAWASVPCPKGGDCVWDGPMVVKEFPLVDVITLTCSKCGGVPPVAVPKIEERAL